MSPSPDDEAARFPLGESGDGAFGRSWDDEAYSKFKFREQPTDEGEVDESSAEITSPFAGGRRETPPPQTRKRTAPQVDESDSGEIESPLARRRRTQPLLEVDREDEYYASEEGPVFVDSDMGSVDDNESMLSTIPDSDEDVVYPDSGEGWVPPPRREESRSLPRPPTGKFPRPPQRPGTGKFPRPPGSGRSDTGKFPRPPGQRPPTGRSPRPAGGQPARPVTRRLAATRSGAISRRPAPGRRGPPGGRPPARRPGPARRPAVGRPTLPPNYPAPGGKDRTLPPNYPAPAGSYKGRTLPPDYPAPGGGKDRTLPPNYPAPGGGKDRTLPPNYPAPGGGKDRTLPPNYPAPGGGKDRTLPPNYPAPGGSKDRTLPPNYPAPGGGGKDRTLPPNYPAPGGGKGRTLPPNYPAPGGGKAETLAPGYSLGAGKSPEQRRREVLGPGGEPPIRRGESSRESFNPIGEIATGQTSSGTYEVRQRGDDFDVISGEGPVLPAGEVDDSAELEDMLTRTQQEEFDEFEDVRDSDLGALEDSDDTFFDDAPLSHDDPFASKVGPPLADSHEIGIPPQLQRTHPEELDAFGTLVHSDERGRAMGIAAGSSESLMRRPLDADSEMDVLSWRKQAQQGGQRKWGEWGHSAEGNAARLLRNLSQLSGQGVISDVGDLSDMESISSERLFPQRGTSQSHEGRGRTMELTQAEIFGKDPSLEQRLFESDEATPLVGVGGGVRTSESVSGTGEISGEWGEVSGEVEGDSKIVAFYIRLIRLWQGDALWILLSLGGALVGPVLIWKGWEYYQTPLVERSRHTLHDVLKPGGSVGLTLGILAAVLFLLNLTYVLRRRFGFMQKLISLRLWLNMHFLFGLTGGSLVLAHSALLANNLVARLSSFAILFAVVSGIFGRYVLSHVPRYLRGEEDPGKKNRDDELRERSSMAGRLTDLRRVLRTGLAQFPKLRDAALEALNPPPETGAKGLLFLGPLLISDFRAMVRNRRLARELKGLMLSPEAKQARPVIKETLDLLKQQSRLERRLSQAEAVRDFMDTWRALHLIMAVVVLATMFLHVVLTRFAV